MNAGTVLLHDIAQRYKSRYGDVENYNKKAKKINVLLEVMRKAQESFVRIRARYHAFPGEERYSLNTKYFLPDGVHLNGAGNFLLYKAVRGMLLKIRHRQPGW